MHANNTLRSFIFLLFYIGTWKIGVWNHEGKLTFQSYSQTVFLPIINPMLWGCHLVWKDLGPNRSFLLNIYKIFTCFEIIGTNYCQHPSDLILSNKEACSEEENYSTCCDIDQCLLSRSLLPPLPFSLLLCLLCSLDLLFRLSQLLVVLLSLLQLNRPVIELQLFLTDKTYLPYYKWDIWQWLFSNGRKSFFLTSLDTMSHQIKKLSASSKGQK